jgi:hypothetical protein
MLVVSVELSPSIKDLPWIRENRRTQSTSQLRNVVNICQLTAETGADHGFCYH